MKHNASVHMTGLIFDNRQDCQGYSFKELLKTKFFYLLFNGFTEF